MTQFKSIASVAVVGGTHGNELTGVHTIKHWLREELAANFSEFQVELLLANQSAIDANKRYMDTDLNRCFKLAELSDASKNSQEQLLAKQINQVLGPKGSARVDFIIDLHTSTANMQTNIVLIKMDEFHLKLAAYLRSLLPNVVVTSESRLMDDHHFLCSIADKGIVVEVGPIPQGSIEMPIFEKTNHAIEAALKFAELYNQQQIPELDDTLPVMSYFSKLYFPTDEKDEIIASVHPNLIHQDYSVIKKGDSIFKSFAGEDILYDGEDAYIAFVNEAAYYDQKIAMCLCNPINYSLSSLQPIG